MFAVYFNEQKRPGSFCLPEAAAAGRLRFGAYFGSMRPARPLMRGGKSLLKTIYCSAVFGNSKPVLWNCLRQTCIKQLRTQCWRNIF